MASRLAATRAHPAIARLVAHLEAEAVAEEATRPAVAFAPPPLARPRVRSDARPDGGTGDAGAEAPKRSTAAAGGPAPRWAAVAAILRVTTAPELLFIRRAESPHDPWSGHMAFPGGRREPADQSLRETALRETREEVGLDVARDGLVLGTLDDLAPRSPHLPPLVIRPYVAIVQAEVAVRTSDEVAEVLWVPVASLRDPAAATEHPFVEPVTGARLRFPGYRVGERVVWGLTERIVRRLLELLG